MCGCDVLWLRVGRHVVAALRASRQFPGEAALHEFTTMRLHHHQVHYDHFSSDLMRFSNSNLELVQDSKSQLDLENHEMMFTATTRTGRDRQPCASRLPQPTSELCRGIPQLKPSERT